MIEEGWLHPGDLVIDPFGGVALGALDAMRLGLRWRGVELEPKFAELGNQNIGFWNAQFSRMPHWCTDDIDAAFDQWEEERKALSSFFNQNEEYEKLIARLKSQWSIIRLRLWGNGPITTDSVPALPSSPGKIKDIIQAALKLDIWHDDVLLAENHQKEVNEYKQIAMKFNKETDEN
jgi:hypothetical protein